MRNRNTALVGALLIGAALPVAVLAYVLDAAGLLASEGTYESLRWGGFLAGVLASYLVLRDRTWRGTVRYVLVAICLLTVALLFALEWLPTSERKEFYLVFRHISQTKRFSPDDLERCRKLGARLERVGQSTIRLKRVDGPRTVDYIVIHLAGEDAGVSEVCFLPD